MSHRLSDFAWPPLPDGTVPVWDGETFRMNGRGRQVLRYSESDAGWDDELTLVHEDAGGAMHYMDLASRRLAFGVLQRFHPRDGVLLEVGCSSGFFLEEARFALPDWDLIGADCVEPVLNRLAGRLPGVPLLEFDLMKCPLPDASVDAVVLLNVFEHIEDDEAAMRQVARVLRPGGVAVVEVPFGPHLYDWYDAELKHYRRYTLGELTKKFEISGLQTIRANYLGCLLYPFFYSVKRAHQVLPSHGGDGRASVARQIRWSSVVPAAWLMSLELGITSHIKFPCGIRCVSIAQRAL